MEFLQLFEILSKRNVRYLLCGGLAVNIYGIPRSTADIDLLVDFEEKNIEEFLSTMQFLSYISSLPFSLKILINKEERDRITKEKNLIAYSFFNSEKNTVSVDVLVQFPISFEAMWQKREIRTLNSLEINLVSIEDLITMKTATGRNQDEKDIQLLSQLLKK